MINDRLSTKQFASMCKVEKRTLHYYDEIDLLKPIEVKENGYRIYSAIQFETMSMIKALQSVGMSLIEIKNLMNEHDLSHCKTVLNNQIHLLQEKQEELKKAEQILSLTSEQLTKYSELGSNNFFIEKVPDTYLITQEIQEEGPFFVNYLTNGYTLGVIISKKGVTRPQYIFKKASCKKDSNALKPSGSYACIYQSVPDGKIAETIQSFVTLLSTKQLVTEGPLYMDSIANDFIRFGNGESVFKLSIKCVHTISDQINNL